MKYLVVLVEIAQALYNPIAYQSQLEQMERRTRQLSVFDDDVEDLQLVLSVCLAAVQMEIGHNPTQLLTFVVTYRVFVGM